MVRFKRELVRAHCDVCLLLLIAVGCTMPLEEVPHYDADDSILCMHGTISVCGLERKLSYCCASPPGVCDDQYAGAVWAVLSQVIWG